MKNNQEQTYPTTVKLVLFSLFILSLFLLISGCSSREQVSYDFDTYLSKDADFEKTIATVMPSKDELKDENVVYYLYYNNGRTEETSAKKMIQLTVKYSDNDFIKTKTTMEQQSASYNSESMSRRFYYNGVLYDGFIFNSNGYCALAYHACSDSKTISYIAFDCWDLQFMDVESALGLFPQFEHKNQIVSYSNYNNA